MKGTSRCFFHEKNIVLVGNSSWSILKFRSGLIKRFISLNYRVTVVAPFDKHTQELKRLGCDYQKIVIDNKGVNPLKDLILIFQLRRIYKRIKPIFIFHYSIKPNIYGTLAAYLSNTISYAVVTGLGYTFINENIVSKISRNLYRFAFKFPKKVFFISRDDRNIFLFNNLVRKDLVAMIPGEGIDTEYFNSADHKPQKNPSKIKFLLIARMLFDKGVREYVEASDILRVEFPNAEFGLLGYLDVENPTAISKKQMKKWEMNNNVVFYGSSDNVKKFIQNSDCIVLPSYREGVSMVLMEAASMKKPLIASNVPGCNDLIDDGINGYLCQKKDSYDLAEKMKLMLNLTNKKREKMGLSGRAKMIESFDEEIVIKKYLSVIKE